jgi:hypothetical protein
MAAMTATGAYYYARCVAQSSRGMAALNMPHAQKRVLAHRESDTSRQDKNVGWHGANRAT